MFRIVGLFFMISLLVGCGKKDSDFDISRFSCPETGLIHEAEDIHIFDNNGKEQVYIILKDFVGGCSFQNKEKKAVMVDMKLTFYAERKPDFPNIKQQDFKYFVTILSPENEILTKKIFSAVVELDEETGTGVFAEEIEQKIPLNELKDAGFYKIIFGLQLTPEQFRNK